MTDIKDGEDIKVYCRACGAEHELEAKDYRLCQKCGMKSDDITTWWAIHDSTTLVKDSVD